MVNRFRVVLITSFILLICVSVFAASLKNENLKLEQAQDSYTGHMQYLSHRAFVYQYHLLNRLSNYLNKISRNQATKTDIEIFLSGALTSRAELNGVIESGYKENPEIKKHILDTYLSIGGIIYETDTTIKSLSSDDLQQLSKLYLELAELIGPDKESFANIFYRGNLNNPEQRKKFEERKDQIEEIVSLIKTYKHKGQ